jgi:hypothetical protein
MYGADFASVECLTVHCGEPEYKFIKLELFDTARRLHFIGITSLLDVIL